MHYFLLYIFVLVYYIYHHNNKQLYNHIHSMYVFDMLLYTIYRYLVFIHVFFLLLPQNLHI